MKKIILFLFVAVITFKLFAQRYEANWASLNKRGIPAWFQQAKFGIFIHWGVYSVPSYAPVIPNSGLSYAEWYWYRIHEGDYPLYEWFNPLWQTDKKRFVAEHMFRSLKISLQHINFNHFF